MVLFAELYKMTDPGKLDRKRVKSQFPIEILVCKFNNVIGKFQSPFVCSPNAKKFAARFLNFLELIKISLHHQGIFNVY